MKNCKLTITFATINPDYTWTPRIEVVEVGWIYAQNEVQIKETAQKFARDNEIVWDVEKEEGSAEIFFKAAKDFKVEFETQDKLIERVSYKKGHKFKYSEYLETDVFGHIIDNSRVLLRKERCGDTCYYPAFVPLENLSAFYYDDEGNEIELPHYLFLIEQKQKRERAMINDSSC